MTNPLEVIPVGDGYQVVDHRGRYVASFPREDVAQAFSTGYHTGAEETRIYVETVLGGLFHGRRPQDRAARVAG